MGYMVSWISALSDRLMGQYFDQSGEYLSDQNMLTYGNKDDHLFKISKNEFAVVSSGNVGVDFTKFELSRHIINKGSSFKVYDRKEDWIGDLNAEKIFDNKAVIVWLDLYDEEHDIYGKIIEY
jgi:hypothetical protein